MPTYNFGQEADSDGDGYDDLMEYALGLDPTTFSSHEDMNFDMNDSSMQLSLTRTVRRMDIRYRLQYSTDLINWSPISLSPSVDNSDQLIFELPLDLAPKTFYRIRIERP